MRLKDAVARLEKLAEGGSVTGLDLAALLSLMEMAKRVQRAAPAIRAVERSLCSSEHEGEHLNQGSLFGEDEG